MKRDNLIESSDQRPLDTLESLITVDLFWNNIEKRSKSLLLRRFSVYWINLSYALRLGEDFKKMYAWMNENFLLQGNLSLNKSNHSCTCF